MTVAECLTQTRRHVLTQTLVGLSATTVTRVLLDSAVERAMIHLNHMAESGDVLATQQAAQAWNKTLKRAIQEGIHASPPV